jgi:Uma2 family endonuclease
MAIAENRMSVEEFERFIYLPENHDRDFEYIAGYAVDILSSPYASSIAATFGALIAGFVYDNNLGHITGAAGAYQVMAEYYMPDVGFISYDRIQEFDKKLWYCPQAPNLALEVVSFMVSERLLMVKVGNYLAAGTVVWVVYPEQEEVAVYQSGKAVKVYSKEDTITSEAVLQGFSLELKHIFK